MFAVGLAKNSKGVKAFEIPKPEIEKPDGVLVRVLEVGIDGTDRAMILHDQKDITENDDKIILGHEAIGIVEEIGKEVRELKKGDLVVPTVRRGCNECISCRNNQSDMCFTGRYKERGIHKLHGFMTEYFVDGEKYLVKIPEKMKGVAVLTEPVSIVEKAMEQVVQIQSRLQWGCNHESHAYNGKNWGRCKKALVIGAGAIGFLGACLLRLEGVETYVVERHNEDSLKGQLIEQIGAKYIDAKNNNAENIMEKIGRADIMLEASGASELALSIIPKMSRNGITVLTGIPRGEYKVCLDGNEMLRQLVRYNQVILGSINGNRTHFQKGLQDMERIRSYANRFHRTWKDGKGAR